MPKILHYVSFSLVFSLHFPIIVQAVKLSGVAKHNLRKCRLKGYDRDSVRLEQTEKEVSEMDKLLSDTKSDHSIHRPYSGEYERDR